MKTILCPTDFSTNAEHAVQYGAALANSLSGRLVLLHIYETPATYSEIPFSMVDASERSIRASAEKKLSIIKAKLLKVFPELHIEMMAMKGLSHQVIVSQANKQDAEFIVMGATGTSRLERLLMGSTTANVISAANCPVLCIPKSAVFEGIKKIVFATDLHEDNIGSARQISFLARHFDAEIIFVFVDEEKLIHSEKEIAMMTRKIRSKVKYRNISGYIVTHSNIKRGLEQFLKKYPADILVMFSHERHFPGTLFGQSVTRLMSHKVKIPLLALKQSRKALLYSPA